MPQHETKVIPNGWIEKPLGQLVKVERGSSPRPIKSFLTEDEDGVNWVKIGDATKGQMYIDSTKEKITPEGAKKSRYVGIGDFILSNSMSFGLPYIMAIPGYIHDGWFVIRLPKEIDSNYFYYLLSSSYLKNQFQLLAAGGVVLNISGDLVKKAFLPIAPHAEQKRIVETLNSLLAQVDTIQQRLNNLPNIIKRFRQSVLAAAVSGKLTEQWRVANSYSALEQLDELQKTETDYIGKKLKDGRTKTFKEKNKLREEANSIEQNEVPTGWVKKPFFEFCLLNRGFDLPTAKRLDGEYPIMSSGGLIGTHNEYKIEAPVITVGRSGSVGKVFYSEKNSWPLNTSLYVKDFGICEPYFLFLALKSFHLEKYSSSSAVPSLNRNEFMFVETLIPPREEQTEIVLLVEQYFALADTLEKNLANAKQRVDNLTQSILAKAFKGELVPQDESDEPADKLLERIKAARAEAEALAKATKKVGNKTKAKKVKSKNGDVVSINRTPNIKNMKAWLKMTNESEFSFATLEAEFDGTPAIIEKLVLSLLEEKKPLIKQKFDAQTGSVNFKIL